MDDEKVKLDFESWLAIGVGAGWVTPDYCTTHDETPLTVLEQTLADADDPEMCIHALRLLRPGDVLAFHSRWGLDPVGYVGGDPR